MSEVPVLNVMIPMGGLGTRFSDEGYSMPKPLIKLAGRCMVCWLLDNLCFGPDDICYIGLSKDLDDGHGVANMLTLEFPEVSVANTLLHRRWDRTWAPVVMGVVIGSMWTDALSRRSLADKICVYAPALRNPRGSGDSLCHVGTDGIRALGKPNYKPGLRYDILQ